MVLDLVVTETDDGITSEIPSLKGCECWAHQEDEAIQKSIDMLRYYVGLNNETEIKIDKARKTNNKTVYKLVFDKDLP